MNFIDSDVTKVLDEVLPARFGGSPTDFQILEEENEDGVPVLKLLVRPSVEFLNEDEVIETFIRGISRGAGANRVIGWPGDPLVCYEWSAASLCPPARERSCTCTSSLQEMSD